MLSNSGNQYRYCIQGFPRCWTERTDDVVCSLPILKLVIQIVKALSSGFGYLKRTVDGDGWDLEVGRSIFEIAVLGEGGVTRYVAYGAYGAYGTRRECLESSGYMRKVKLHCSVPEKMKNRISSRCGNWKMKGNNVSFTF